jgi:hypothetical protein
MLRISQGVAVGRGQLRFPKEIKNGKRETGNGKRPPSHRPSRPLRRGAESRVQYSRNNRAAVFFSFPIHEYSPLLPTARTFRPITLRVEAVIKIASPAIIHESRGWKIPRGLLLNFRVSLAPREIIVLACVTGDFGNWCNSR